MRARSIAIFAIGFASGALCICVLLWGSGNLQAPPSPSVARAQPQPVAAPPAAEKKPDAPPAPSAPDPNARLLLPIAGVNPSALTDNFNELRDGRKHEALDIPSPRGTPVRACAEGNVVKLFQSKQGGLTVYQFDDSQTYCYYYAHLDHYANGLREGMLLRRGDILGYVGSTGNASPQAPHLHFAVFALGPEKKWWQGTPIDPLPMFR